MKHHLFLFSTVFFSACGTAGDTDQASSEIHSQLTPCLEGEDLDGDGVVDRFSITHAHFFDTATPQDCLRQGGTPWEWVRHGSALRASAASAATASPPAGMPYNAGGTLPAGVSRDVARIGAHNHPYVKGSHDCDDFANDLETALEDLGYHATYTEICIPSMAGDTWHAITDVHLDGKTYWIDAQSGKQLNLDEGGNGTVQTSTSGTACARATEGGWGVRVWENLDARIMELGSPD